MELSLRLKNILLMIEKCESIVDVGTDHAYIPIQAVKDNICKSAIASDINKGPVEKAILNVKRNNLSKSIECRLGGGLTTVRPYEANVAIIAGMGGNLIRDIIEDSLDVFKSLDYAILQPVQNAEVLREYIYNKGYKIIDEDICREENKFYEIIKIKYDNNPKTVDTIYYEFSKILIEKKRPIMKEYLEYKLNRYTTVYNSLKEETPAAKLRKEEIEKLISKLKEFLKWL